MSNISWDNLMNTIDDTWNYDIHGYALDNYLDNVDVNKLYDTNLSENRFRKRKHDEKNPHEIEIEYSHKKYKY